ncbi:hypothetical protein MICAF_3150005 [Microcystis aeruginosa PCC 9807]|uniref:Uncharacterized protein n=1 Tax=Microcystis aeruginosa PCC 9807 TaxID=1160283 RepID=I4H6V6_MICAE|nr:hypothetical protein MICAF_3150005 [Microcystis aeruginosa PCC 9807]
MSIYVVGRGDIQKVDPYRCSGECYAEGFRHAQAMEEHAVLGW